VAIVHVLLLFSFYYLNELRAGWRDEGTIRKRGAKMRHYPFAINVKMWIALVTGVPYFNFWIFGCHSSVGGNVWPMLIDMVKERNKEAENKW
jgi:hypothetical protein